ncbi:MAG: putative 4-hydroxybenzoate polyprenyltransferase [Phycisphaeraceae bacterium]|nr:putative 4-hydroxybenzoate polyprenyltransferase [Phycisphaeraceae bacterium]
MQSTLAVAARDIKLAHSVFALPFALLAAVLAHDAEEPAGRLGGQIALVAVCMVLARTWAMLFNRIADRRFDAGNPRTAGRALPAGRLSVREAWLISLGCAGLFILACGGFWVSYGNPWPLVLSVPTLAWIALYSLTKRFTVLCHFFLGGALAFSPVAAAIALRPEALADTPSIWLLSAMVFPWVAGFDVIYALQDMEFDRRTGLRSIPALLGERSAKWVARALHVLAFGALAAALWVEPRFSDVFLSAVLLVGGLLVVEHIVLARRGMAGIPAAFFTYNGIVSCVVGAAGIADAML